MMQNISKLQKLELHVYHVTFAGLHELSTTLSGCENLKHVVMTLRIIIRKILFLKSATSYLKLLSCSNIKELKVFTFPFRPFNTDVPNNLQCLDFFIESYMHHKVTVLFFFDCLSCIADMFKAPSMKFMQIFMFMPQSLGCFHGVPPDVYSNFIAILNNSLNPAKNLSLSHSSLCLMYPIPHNSLSRALRKDPAIPRLNLRRSRSLCDLTVIEYGSFGTKLQKEKLKLIRSCPDMLDLQSLNNMQPQLYNFFSSNFYGCYCDFHDRWRRKKNQYYDVTVPKLRTISHIILFFNYICSSC